MNTSSNWYAHNSLRNYPLDDMAHREDVYGNRLPNDLILDLNLWYPGNDGERAFISSVCVTPGMVSLTISRQDLGLTPLAAVAVPRPVLTGQSHALEPYIDGVAGWVVFGDGVEQTDDASYRFDDPLQSRLSPRAAEAEPAPGVPWVRAGETIDQLTGDVLITSDTPGDLVIKREEIEIGNVQHQAIVFGLNVAEQGNAVLADYVGECDRTPDSRTCTYTPIDVINDVTPDAEGTLYLYIVEEVDPDLGPMMGLRPEGNSTLYIDYAIGLETVCNNPAIEPLLDKLDDCDDGSTTIDPNGPFSDGPPYYL